jgi:response regulator RpfG family c-di-GMP phosphodiesterase
MTDTAPTPSLLLVDDEPNILAALRRLFRPCGYRIFTAESGAQGLDILAGEQIDLVISDMRMPRMSGAQFLEQVRERSPDTVRILLTGHSDIAATVDAVNRGGILRYVAKPWEDNDMLLGVRHALERQQLEREKRRLEALTGRQNEELRELNASLEEKVRARTHDLEQAHDKLKKSFITSIRVFSNLIELRETALAGHSKRVAELARAVARGMDLAEREVQDVFLAGLLHDIGKIGLSDRLLTRPWATLSSEERTEFSRHAIKGEASLMALEQLHDAARLIRNHHERFDGMGYPDGLSGSAIPLGARILAAVNDYDGAQIGTLSDKRLGAKEALAMLIANAGSRYDPDVVNALLQIIGAPAAAQRQAELAKISSELEPGMVLARDLYTRDGIMLLPKGCVLNQRYVGKIRAFEQADERPLAIYIQIRER